VPVLAAARLGDTPLAHGSGWLSHGRYVRCVKKLSHEPVLTLACGQRGLIRRTSSGKPRRSYMWQLTARSHPASLFQARLPRPGSSCLRFALRNDWPAAPGALHG